MNVLVEKIEDATTPPGCAAPPSFMSPQGRLRSVRLGGALFRRRQMRSGGVFQARYERDPATSAT
jgi:hypothetical protein